MEELVKWLKENVGDNIQIITPQFERTEPLEYHYTPETPEQFYTVIKKAPWAILKGLGFGKWDTMNNIIKENQEMKGAGIVHIPIINAKQGETLDVNLSKKDCPQELLEVDEDVLLFPGEWYDFIPDGFMVTGLNGEQYPFKRGESDDDIRFGCLPYGIRRAVNKGG